MAKEIQLIVNADDFGYWQCVSRGILHAANHGRITATSIMANSTILDELAPELLKVHSTISVGVHLNLTSGYPLSKGMKQWQSSMVGRFPGKGDLLKLILTNKLSLELILEEYRQQIEECLSRGFNIEFLNSHEHIHMLPMVYEIVRKLSLEYGIKNIRWTRPDIIKVNFSSMFRSAALGVMGLLNKNKSNDREPIMLGLSQSGKLSLEGLVRIFNKLQPGNTYELMCHPGFFDKNEIIDESLLGYHDWEGELALLMSDELMNLYTNNRIKLINYSSI